MAYKRDGVWYYDFTLNKIRHNKSTQARNKRQAEDIERKVRNDMVLGIHGLVSPKDCPTVKAFFDGRFLDFVRVRSKKKPRTIAYYEEKVKRLLEFDIAGFQLFELDPDKIDQLKTACSAKQWNATTVNHVLKTLRHGLNMAEEWGLIRRAPKVRMLPGEVGRDYVLSYQTEALYFSKVREPLLTAAVLMVDTGLRPDECVSRPWTDVFLQPAPDAKYGYIRITDGKTKNAKRNIPLTERARLMLQLRRAVYPEETWVFPGQRKKGPHMTVSALDHIHTALRRETIDNETGKPLFPDEFVIYSLRHTFGTRLGESGAPPFTIMSLMGHASITTSQKYSHPTPEHIERAMGRKELMDRLMRGELKAVPAVSTTDES